MRFAIILLCCVLVSSLPTPVRAGFAVEVVSECRFTNESAGYPMSSHRFGDMDGDGSLETFVSQQVAPPYRILHLKDGRMDEIRGWPELALGVLGWDLVDVDGDGQAELVIAATQSSTFDRVVVVGWDAIHPSSSPEASAESGIARASFSPNPSPGACKVSFTVPQTGMVSGVLFDVGGRRVRELLRGTFPVGDYSPLWDGRDDTDREVAAGVYLVKVTTPAGETSARVVLMR